jgi:sugar/nucleoside kinase (ribokinase family)
MGLNFDVIVVGSYSVDLIFSGLPELPQLGKDIVGTGFQMTPGDAFISAVSMHRLGMKVGWAADFGNDDFSRFALKCAREEGLDESLFVHHDRSYRRVTAAASYPDDRAFITYYDPEPQVPAAMPALFKSSARILFVPGLYTGSFLGPAIKLIHSKKMILAMDGNSSAGDIIGSPRLSKAIRKAIKSCDIFLPNALEARTLTGAENIQLAIARLGELCPLVVIKDGANGSLAISNRCHTSMPAISVHPIDTTGAGDNFNAGFLYSWLDGQPMENCLKWGNIVGGLSTTVMGGTVRRITCEDVKKYLDNW